MSRYSYYGFAPYVSVAQKRINAEKLAKKLTDKGEKLEPVSTSGKKLATTFWGESWNKNLERYRDYENRLPRGRSYLRHGAVIDLKIKNGEIQAMVNGSSLYRVSITIKPLHNDRWQALKNECSGEITSLIGLLQGKLPPSVMAAVTQQERGLFPEPKDIRFKCSCPDSAGICKHCAAVVYGVGVRLDHSPELLFLLRGVDHTELITGASDAVIAQTGENTNAMALGEISSVFGIELDAPTTAVKVAAKKTAKKAAKKAAKKTAKKAVKNTAKKAAKNTAKKTSTASQKKTMMLDSSGRSFTH